MNLWKSQTPAEPCLGDNVAAWCSEICRICLSKSTVSWHLDTHTPRGLGDMREFENRQSSSSLRFWQSSGKRRSGPIPWHWRLQLLSCAVSILIVQFKWTLDLQRICSTWASQYNDTGAVVIHHPAVSNHQKYPQATCSGHGCSLFTFNFHWRSTFSPDWSR